MKMNEDDVNLCLNFPGIKKEILKNEKKSIYYGLLFFDCGIEPANVYITKVDGNPFKIDYNVDHKLRKHKEEIGNRTGAQNIEELLSQIQTILKSKCHKSKPINFADIYEKTLDEYNEFTRFFLNLKRCKLSNDLKSIFVSTLDEKNREHSVTIVVNYENKFEDTFKMSSYDLPCQNPNAELFETKNDLITLFDQFLSKIEYLQPYFDLMDTLDNVASILDPENPKRSISYRRIWLGENISVLITFHPYNIFTRPDMRFLGPDSVVDAYRTRLNDNLEGWDDRSDTVQGILGLLGLDEFPQKPKDKNDTEMVLVNSGECSICFSLRLNEKIPEIICKTASCQKYYHEECLYEWLTSVNARRMFREVYGECPNCEKSISCSIPEK